MVCGVHLFIMMHQLLQKIHRSYTQIMLDCILVMSSALMVTKTRLFSHPVQQ